MLFQVISCLGANPLTLTFFYLALVENIVHSVFQLIKEHTKHLARYLLNVETLLCLDFPLHL